MYRDRVVITVIITIMICSLWSTFQLDARIFQPLDALCVLVRADCRYRFHIYGNIIQQAKKVNKKSMNTAPFLSIISVVKTHCGSVSMSLQGGKTSLVCL